MHSTHAILFSAFLAAHLIFISACRSQPYDASPGRLVVMTWNVEWMFDDYRGDNRSKLAQQQSAATREAWDDKLQAVAGVIAKARPNIVALQEIEGDQTLDALAKKLKSDHELEYRFAFIQGTDSFTEQDVGFLFRDGLTSYRRQEQSKAMFDSGQYYNLSKHLFALFQWSDVPRPMTFLNLHLRAKAEAEDIRVRQARLARHWVEPLLYDEHDVIVLGDFNSETKAGEKHSDIGTMLGQDDSLVDLLTRLKNPEESTHLVVNRQFDRILVSRSLIEDGPGLDWSFASIEILTAPVIRGAPDGPAHWHQPPTLPVEERDISDHFPVVAEFVLK